MTGGIGLTTEVRDIGNKNGRDHARAKALNPNGNDEDTQMIANQRLNDKHKAGDTLQSNAHKRRLKDAELMNHDAAEQPPKNH